jgi:hypothetical protein
MRLAWPGSESFGLRNRNPNRWIIVVDYSFSTNGISTMSVHPIRSGDHLEQTPYQKPAVVSDVPSRQGVTGHNVRYMLLFGTCRAVIGLISAMIFFFH